MGKKRINKCNWAGTVWSPGRRGKTKTVVLLTDTERKRGEKRLKKSMKKK